jgi:hypothetical protein
MPKVPKINVFCLIFINRTVQSHSSTIDHFDLIISHISVHLALLAWWVSEHGD